MCCGQGRCCPQGSICTDSNPPRCKPGGHESQLPGKAHTWLNGANPTEIDDAERRKNDMKNVGSLSGTSHAARKDDGAAGAGSDGKQKEHEEVMALAPVPPLPPLPPLPAADLRKHLPPPPCGEPWPPAGGIVNTGESGMWANPRSMRIQADWRGLGMIRNGTYNIVKDRETCQDQCQVMRECRMVMYDAVTHKCWLDSEVSASSQPCPVHNMDFRIYNKAPNDSLVFNGTQHRDLASCFSYFKRVQESDVQYPYTTTDLDRSHWIIKEQQNWNGPARRSLTRNGRYNIVENERACQRQCADPKYCRAAVFFRPNKECWLASRVGPWGLRCAKRDGRRDCVGFIKKRAVPDIETIRDELAWTDAPKFYDDPAIKVRSVFDINPDTYKEEGFQSLEGLGDQLKETVREDKQLEK